MARSTPNNNVFKFLITFRTNLTKLKQTGVVNTIDKTGNQSEITYSAEEVSKIVEAGEVFLSNFEDYLRRGDYTRSKFDIELVEYKLSGYTNREVMEHFDIQDSALRMRYARLTKKVYRSAFNRETVPDDLVSLKTEQVIKKANNCLHAAVLRINLSDVFSFDTLKAIEQATNGIQVKGKVGTDMDYCKAFRFVTLYSMSTLRAVLSSLNPEVLAYILSEMRSKKVNSTCNLYNKLMNYPAEILNMTLNDFSDIIDKNDFNFRTRGNLTGVDAPLVSTQETLRKLEEREKSLASKEQSLISRELTLNDKEKELADKEAKLKQLQQAQSVKKDEKIAVKSNKFNIPCEYYALIEKYIAEHEDELAKPSNKYIIYKGSDDTTKDTRKKVANLLSNITLSNFNKTIRSLNPYDLKFYIDNANK